MSAEIAVTMFILTVNLGIFALPFLVDFSKSQFTNLLLRRCCWVLGIYLLMLNAAIMSTIASNSALPLTNEMFRYMWLFGMAGYVLMGYLVLKTLVDLLTLSKQNIKTRRMGRQEEDMT